VPVIGTSNKIRAGTHWKRDCEMQSFFDAESLIRRADHEAGVY